jgi:hypothetical protein
LVPAQCPKCGAGVKLDASQEHVTCAYCGTSSFIVRDRPPPATPPPESLEPTIYVSPAKQSGLAVALVVGFIVLIAASAVYATMASEARLQAAAPAPKAAPAPTGDPNERAVTLEPPVVEAGEPIADAEQVVAAMGKSIRDCYDTALGEKPHLRGTFSLHIRVTPGATEVTVSSSELPADALECMQTSARGYSFAPQPGTTVLRVDGKLRPAVSPCACAPGDPLCQCP